MQDWRQQAAKNSLNIIESGRCQLCDSKTEHGISECIDIANLVTHKIDHAAGVYTMTIFLCVDAHALQHSEIHGRWNNHFHLTRLRLILEDGFRWNYALSPLLSEVLDSYKIGKEWEIIQSPGIGMRGPMTVTDVQEASSEERYIDTAWAWAQSVYSAFSQGHQVAKEIANIFKGKAKGHLY